jgi:hypothetical protein
VNKRELIEAIRADRATLQSLWADATDEQLCRHPVITNIIWDTVEHYHDHLADVRAWAEREGLSPQ